MSTVSRRLNGDNRVTGKKTGRPNRLTEKEVEHLLELRRRDPTGRIKDIVLAARRAHIPISKGDSGASLVSDILKRKKVTRRGTNRYAHYSERGIN